MARVAVIEDEETVSACVAYSLQRLGHEVTIFHDGRAARQALERELPQMFVLDLMLPNADGLDLCRAIRECDARVPILILTARGEEIDRVVGLECGADDYVVKPFSVRELEARLKALLRRSGLAPQSETEPIVMGAFCLDRRCGSFRLNGAPISLSRRQMALLAVLMAERGGIISREVLLRRVWGEDYAGEAKTLDVHIRWLREKIECDPSAPRHILTVRGRGYRFEVGDVPPPRR